MPGGNKNIKPEDATNNLAKNPQNRGRKPRKIYNILKQTGYSRTDIMTVFEELPFYKLKELKELFEDESKPVIARIVANQLWLALKNGEYGKIKEILSLMLDASKRYQPKQDKIEIKIEYPDGSSAV